MARKRKLNREPSSPSQRSSHAATVVPKHSERLTLVSAGGLGAILVATTIFPGDSTSVEQGTCLFWCAVVIAWAALAWLSWSLTNKRHLASKRDWLIDIFAWSLAGWMWLAAFMTSPPGNLRSATNEAWLWVAAAAVFTASRRIATGPAGHRGGLRFLVVAMAGIATGLAASALYQQWVTLPADIATYRADPDKVLEQLGIDAPPGSALRMAFENRLLDGGPTATFALSNSLAGVLGMGLIAAAGTLPLRWRWTGSFARFASLVGISLIVVALMATGSRTGMLASLIVLMGLLIQFNWTRRKRVTSPSETVLPPRRISGSVVASILSVAATAALAFVTLGRKEWFAEAPASIAFRVQYWRTSMRMVLDHPWFGCGPGHFKVAYDRYREPSANEQIADPHNFLLETVTAGGLMAGCILVTLFVLVVRQIGRAKAGCVGEPEVGFKKSNPIDSLGMAAFSGAIFSLVSIVGFGLLVPQWINLAGILIAIPFGLAMVWINTRRDGRASVETKLGGENPNRTIALACAVFLLMHLGLSGGWTVPGIGIWIWVIGGSLTPMALTPMAVDNADVQPVRSDSGSILQPVPLGVLTAGLVLLLSLQQWSIGPVRGAHFWLADAQSRQSRGDMLGALRSLDQASLADPWSETAAVTKVISLGWALTSLPTSDQTNSPTDDPMLPRERELRRQLTNTSAQILARNSANAAVLRELIGVRLHLYQRLGHRSDLEASEKLLDLSVEASPSHQWHHAQRAAVLREIGKKAAAQSAATKASILSRLGNNPERSLSRQMLYVPQPNSDVRQVEPLRRPASELLENLLATGDVEAVTTD